VVRPAIFLGRSFGSDPPPTSVPMPFLAGPFEPRELPLATRVLFSPRTNGGAANRRPILACFAFGHTRMPTFTITLLLTFDGVCSASVAHPSQGFPTLPVCSLRQWFLVGRRGFSSFARVCGPRPELNRRIRRTTVPLLAWGRTQDLVVFARRQNPLLEMASRSAHPFWGFFSVPLLVVRGRVSVLFILDPVGPYVGPFLRRTMASMARRAFVHAVGFVFLDLGAVACTGTWDRTGLGPRALPVQPGVLFRTTAFKRPFSFPLGRSSGPKAHCLPTFDALLPF